MIPALQKDDSLLEDISKAPPEENLLHVWWLGQSGFLCKWTTHHFLFDPYLSDSLTKKYEGTEKPHVRMAERVIDPARLDMVELVTSSHSHTDHLDPETLRPLVKANPGISLFLPAANVEIAQERLGDARAAIISLDAGSVMSFKSYMITAVAAAHDEVTKDDDGHTLHLGFVLRIGPFTIFHSGDTRPHDGLIPALLKHKIDLCLLPINGHDPARGVAGNLWGAEAAATAWACRTRMVIPCHYDMFEFNTETPYEFVATCNQLEQPHKVLRCGERLTMKAAD